MWLTVEQPRKRGRYAEKSWRTRLDSKENQKHMFMFCLVVWSVVIFAEYPKFTQAGRPVYVIENVRESSSVPPLDGTMGAEHDGRVAINTALPRQKTVEEGRGQDALVAITALPESIEEKIRQAWKGTGDEEIAIAVATAESGLRADAVGDRHIEFIHEGRKMGHSCGVFQIRVLQGRPDCETLKDVDKNIEFAKKLYDKSGFHPWSAWRNNSFLKFL